MDILHLRKKKKTEMDTILGKMDGRFKAFMKDSTMMRIVNYAMDKAYEKVKSKEGTIVRLHEISKFYQLAVMQLEVCMKFVQDESDSCVSDSNPEDVLAGLHEIRDRLQRRLQESEIALSDKDRELNERLASEIKLRQELERREKELVSFRAANLDIERTKSEDGEFCELKNSVDQQVLNIKHKLVEEDQDEKKFENNNLEITKIEHMGSDIDVLKQTMDLAFNKMQDTIFMSELGPLEQQWRWDLERDIIAVLIKCFMEDSNEEKKITRNFRRNFQDLMKESNELRGELELFLLNQNEIQLKNLESHDKKTKTEENVDNFAAELIKNHESIIRRKSVERNPQVISGKGSTGKKQNEFVNTKRIQDVIAKLDHFSNWNTRLGDVPEECSCSVEARSGVDSFEDVWERLNKKKQIPNESNEKKLCNEIRILKQEREDSDFQIAIMDEIYRAVFGSLLSEFRNELCDRDIEGLLREDICYPVFRETTEDSRIDCQQDSRNNGILQFRNELGDLNIEGIFRETMEDSRINCRKDSASTVLLFDDLEEFLTDKLCIVVFQEMYREWNEVSFHTENDIREEIFQMVFVESIRGILNCADQELINLQKEEIPRNFNESTENEECSLQADVSLVFLRKMFEDWNEESFRTENDIREEISRLVFVEFISDILKFPDQELLNRVETPRHFNKSTENEEYSLQIEVYLVFIRKMLEDRTEDLYSYEFASLVREEIHEFVIIEALKDACTKYENLEKIPKDMLPLRARQSRRESSGVEYMVQTIETLIKCFEAGEDLMFKAHSEIQEHNMQLDLVGLELVELDEYQIFQEFLTGEKNTSISVNMKLEKALHHLVSSREVLSELGSSLGITVRGAVFDRMTSVSASVDEKEHCQEMDTCQEIDINDETKLMLSDVSASPVPDFAQLLVDFEWITHHKLQTNIFRLERFKSDLNPLIEQVAMLREKDSLYQKAFITRCQNLRKAEIEVDLLGDQVDTLLGLLEKIYLTLNYHSPELQQYFEVSNILRLIKKELNGEVHASKH